MCLINYGALAGKLCVIVNVVDCALPSQFTYTIPTRRTHTTQTAHTHIRRWPLHHPHCKTAYCFLFGLDEHLFHEITTLHSPRIHNPTLSTHYLREHSADKSSSSTRGRSSSEWRICSSGHIWLQGYVRQQLPKTDTTLQQLPHCSSYQRQILGCHVIRAACSLARVRTHNQNHNQHHSCQANHTPTVSTLKKHPPYLKKHPPYLI